MTRKEVDGIIRAKIEIEASRAGMSIAELTRELLVTGIRQMRGEADFLKPYPEKEAV